MRTCNVDSSGDIEWRLDGKRHREDGPAIVKRNGAQEWRRKDLFHREDGPAIVAPGYRAYLRNGNLYREDVPSVVFPVVSEDTMISGIEAEHWPTAR